MTPHDAHQQVMSDPTFGPLETWIDRDDRFRSLNAVRKARRWTAYLCNGVGVPGTGEGATLGEAVANALNDAFAKGVP